MARGAVPQAHMRGPQFLPQCFAWAFALMSFLLRLQDWSVLQKSLLFSGLVYSTHFSGIGTAEYAAQLIKVASARVMPRDVSFNFGPSCEKDHKCDPHLQRFRESGACLFANILTRCQPARQKYEEARAGEDLGPLKAVWESLVAHGCSDCGGFCRTHRFNCPTPRANVDISGSHCTLWSAMGARKGTRSYQIFFLLSWCLWLLWAKCEAAIHENVDLFDVDFLRSLVGHLFEIVALPASPSGAGWHFVKRSRTYLVLYLRGMVRMTHCITAAYQSCLAALAESNPEVKQVPLSACFIATAEELKGEEAKLLRRPSIRDRSNFASGSSWELFLTAKQKQYIRDYARLWQEAGNASPGSDANCVFDISQNPLKRPRASCNGCRA